MISLQHIYGVTARGEFIKNSMIFIENFLFLSFGLF